MLAFLLPPIFCLLGYTERGNYFLKKHFQLLCLIWEATEGIKEEANFDYYLCKNMCISTFFMNPHDNPVDRCDPHFTVREAKVQAHQVV